MGRYRYTKLATAGACHVARVVYRPGDRLPVHTHDFLEVFWLEAGLATHLIGGAKQKLTAGQVVFIRPDDAHGFAGRDRFTLVNVALPRASGRALEKRYDTRYWLQSSPLPHTAAVAGRADLAELGKAAERLALNVESPRRRDAFLLNLFEMLERGDASAKQESTTDSPSWLRRALQPFSDEELREGWPALVRRADRTREHLGRSLRQHHGTSPTAWINDRRLDRAAYLLRMSDTPILNIALDVGFDHLGYFYRKFKDRFATTPRRYRQRERAFVV